MQAAQHTRLGRPGMIVLDKWSSNSGGFICIGAKGLGEKSACIAVPVWGHEDDVGQGLAFKLHIDGLLYSHSLSALEK